MSSHSTRSRNKMKKEDPEKYQRYLESQKKRSADYRQKMRDAKANPTKEDEEKRQNHLKKQRERMKRYLERKKKQKSATATESVPEVKRNSSKSNHGPDDVVSSTTDNINEHDKENEDMVTSNALMSQESEDPSAQNMQHSGDSTDEGFLEIDTSNRSHRHDEVIFGGNSSHEDMQVEEREVTLDNDTINNVDEEPVRENSSQNRQHGERGTFQLIDTADRNHNTQNQGRNESGNSYNDSIGHVYDFSPQSQINLQEVQMSVLDKDVNTQDQGIANRGIFDKYLGDNIPQLDIQNVQSHPSTIRSTLNFNDGAGLQLQNPIGQKTILNLDTRQPFDDQGLADASSEDILAARNLTDNDRPTFLPSLDGSSLPIDRLMDSENTPHSQTTFGNVPTAAVFHTSPPLDLSGRGSLLFPTTATVQGNSSTQQMTPLGDSTLTLTPANENAYQPNEEFLSLNSIAAGFRTSDTGFSQVSAHDRILDSIVDPSRQGPTPHKRYLSQQPRNTSLAPTITGLCTKHPGENIRVWCADCDQLLCVMCLPQHRRHAVSGYRVLQQRVVTQEIKLPFTIDEPLLSILLTGNVFYMCNGYPYITTYNKITGETDEILSVSGDIYRVCLSPDNNSVWYSTDDEEVYQYDIENKTHQQHDIAVTGEIYGICVTRRGVVLGVGRRCGDDSDTDSDGDTDSDSDDDTGKCYLELYSKEDSYKTRTKSVCIYGKRSLRYGVVPDVIKECPVTGDLLVAGYSGNTVLLTDDVFNTKYWFTGKTVTNRNNERRRTGYRNGLNIQDISFDKEGNILILNDKDNAAILIDHDTGRHIRTVYRHESDGEIWAMCIQDNGLLWCAIYMYKKEPNILKSIKYMEKL